MSEDSPTAETPATTDSHTRHAVRTLVARAREKLGPWLAFWTKLNNDWVFNLSGLLAYNFLMSMFPILLVLLAVVGFVLGDLAPQVLADMQHAMEQLVPGGAEIFAAVTRQLTNSAKPLLIIGIVTAAFTGSRLFLVLENCFGIIFRVRGRPFIRQNLMAFGMLVLYLILVPVITLASVVPTTLLNIVSPHIRDTTTAFLTYVLSIAASGLTACILIGGIYVVVPNRPVRLGEIWPGTLLAALLLILYVSLFPIYTSLFLHPANYGSVAGFAVIILLFFYYLAFIILLGAEVNSWMAGLRPFAGDPPWMFHEAMKGRRISSLE